MEGNELGAAFGLVQLERLNKNILVRQENFRRQVDFFSKYQDLFGLPVVSENADTAFLAFPVLISNSAPFNRRDFQIYLKTKYSNSSLFHWNIMRQPMMRGVQFKVSRFGYVNADNVMMNGVLLPVHHGMTESMFDRLHLTIDKFISSKNESFSYWCRRKLSRYLIPSLKKCASCEIVGVTRTNFSRELVSDFKPSIVINTVNAYSTRSNTNYDIYYSNLFFGIKLLKFLEATKRNVNFINCGTALPKDYNVYSMSKHQFVEFACDFSPNNLKFINLRMQSFGQNLSKI